MKKLEILLTDKQHNLLERIAQADDRRLSDLIYLVFSSGLGVYFCERGIYVSKNDDEYTEQEIKQKEINKKLLLDNPKFHYQTEQEQKEQGFKPVENGFSNYSYSKKDFIDVLADEIKNNALNLIKQDFKEIEENTIKENIPGQLVKTFISPIDNCKFDYFISNNILSYRIEGTSNWQDFIPNNRDLSEKQNKEFNQLLEEVKSND